MKQLRSLLNLVELLTALRYDNVEHVRQGPILNVPLFRNGSCQTALEERGQKELATCIVRVQAAEKEKLTLVAAHHLDRLKSTVLLGSEHITGSKTEAQEKYLAEQIAACQERIGEATEELQCCLCEIE